MSTTREEQEHPGGTTSAAMTGARFAAGSAGARPDQRAHADVGVGDLLAGRRHALRALRRRWFNDSLYESVIQTLAYVMMALGLNIVVGFAGLLDLGYVAFFAIGAFVSGWLMSSFFDTKNVHIVVSDITQQPAGHPRQLLLRHLHRGGVHRDVGSHPRRPDAAPARRLPGDRHAGVRRDRAARVRVLERPSGSTSPTAARASPRSTSRGRRSRASTTSPASTSRPSTSSRSRCCWGCCSSTCACATRASAAPGSRSARTRSPPLRWASTSCA